MDINAANITALTRLYTTAWQSGIAWKAPVDLSFLVTDFPSSTKANFYAWLNMIPAFREWLGDRQFRNLKSDQREQINRDWEDSVRMPRNDILDDQYGIYAPIITMMGQAWQQCKYDWAIEVLTGNPECFTSKALFATDHPYGPAGTTLSNLTTDALSATTFEAAFTTAAEWQHPNGELVRPRFTHLVVGEKNRSTAHAIVESKFVVSGSSQIDNPNYKRCQLVVLPELAGTYDDYWGLFDSTLPVKLIARQIRQEAAPLMDTRVEQVMRTGFFDFMADGRGCAGPAFPFLGYMGRL